MPSVIMKTPPIRSAGTSARPAFSAENRRVPSFSASVRGCFDDANIDIAERLEPLLQFGAGGFRLLRPLADRLAAALVDDDGDDILERPAIFPHERGIGQRQQDEAKTQRPQQRAAAAAVEGRAR